jgi:hypothetical protein
MGINTKPPHEIDASATNAIADIGTHGGRLATVLSALALIFSGFSFYETSLKTAELAVYVPPVIQYARDGGGDTELFAIPVTIVNDGARTGTVLLMELEAENLKDGTQPKVKRYYSAFFGEHPREAVSANRAFAPLSIPGRSTFTETIRFYPIGEPLPRLVQDAGEFKFTLKLQTAKSNSGDIWDTLTPKPSAITFVRTLPWMSEQQLNFRRGTISMHDKDWQPSSSTAQ